MVDGLETQYTLDVATKLSQVLVEDRGGTTTTYLYGVGRVAYRESTTGWKYYLADGLGSVRQEVGESGEISTAYRFDPYGAPLQSSGGNPFGYTGEQWDGQTQLLYLRARYYSPGVGRFVSKDPWAGHETTPQTLNRYAYVINNPVNLTDPRGLWPPDRWLWKYIPGDPVDWMTEHYMNLSAATAVTGESCECTCEECFTEPCPEECYSKKRNYPSAWDTEDEVILFAKMLQSETINLFFEKNESIELDLIVAAFTVKNRVSNGRYGGNTYRAVLLNPGACYGLTRPRSDEQ